MFETVERFGKTWYGLALVCFLPLFLVYAPLLSGVQALQWGDDIAQSVPYFSFYSRALHSGESFLWNPSGFSGYPMFATSFGFFAPWNCAIASIVQNPATFVFILPWFALIIFTLAMVFFMRLLLDVGVPFFPAYLGAIALAAGQRTDHIPHMLVAADLFLPLFLFLLWRTYKQESWIYASLGACTLGLGWLGVNFQQAFYIVVASFAFSAYCAVRIWRGRQPQQFRKFILRLAVIYVVGSAIGSVQLVPTNMFASLSTRNQGISYEQAREDAVLPSDFLRWVIPGVKLPQGIPFGSRGSPVPFYMGITALFFFSLMLFSRSRELWNEDQRWLIRFFRWLLGGALAISIVYSPFFFLMSKLPLFSYFRIPWRWTFLATFSASVLVAFGAWRFFRMIEREGGRPMLLRSLKIFSCLVLSIAAGVVAINVMLLFEAQALGAIKILFSRYAYHFYQPAGTLPPEFYFTILDKYFYDLHQYFSLSNGIVLAAFLSLILALATLFFVLKKKSITYKQALTLIVAVTLGNFFLVKPFTYSSMPAGALKETPETIAFLREHPGRAIPFLSEDYEEDVARPLNPTRSERYLLRVAMLVPNTNLTYGVDSMFMKDSLEPLAIARLMSYIGAPVVTTPRTLWVEGEQAFDTITRRTPLLDFLGVRYIVSGYDLSAGFPKVFEGTVSAKNIPVSIYENKTARPMAYFAQSVSFTNATEEEIFTSYRDSNFSGLHVACRDSCVPGEKIYGVGAIQTAEESNGRLRLNVSSEKDGFLVVSQNNLPGWQAFIDGQETQRLTVNTVFIGLEISRGRHEVLLEYKNPCGNFADFIFCIGKKS